MRSGAIFRGIYLCGAVLLAPVLINADAACAQPGPGGEMPPPPTPTQPPPQQAPSGIDLVSVSPTVTRVPKRPVEFPDRLSVYVLQGVKGTTYTAIFSAPQEPAVIIAVGANISSTSYDTTTHQETVIFEFSDSIVTTTTPPFPANHFILIVDPGVTREYNPQPKPGDGFQPPRVRVAADTDTVSCLGPGNRSGNASTQAEQGPPVNAAGTHMSTNLFDWCVIPPTETLPQFGFRLGGPPGTKGFFKKKLGKGLVTLLSQLAGKTLTTKNLAIFNNGFEASKSIVATDDGGAIININVTFAGTQTTVANSPRPPFAPPPTGPLRTAADTSSVSKTITTSEAEKLSLSPTFTSITKAKTSLYGFVDDISTISDIGSRATSTVTIQRKTGSTYKTIATTTLNSDGSYTKNISTATLFAGKKTATLIARIDGSETRISRTVSLKNLTSTARK